jgi:hypothetical protein
LDEKETKEEQTKPQVGVVQANRFSPLLLLIVLSNSDSLFDHLHDMISKILFLYEINHEILFPKMI